jgi:branched-chain amino acid transport system ATP-binding protein
MSEMIVELENLWSGYNGVPVLRDVSLTVQEGEIVGLLGPNGAGKSTTLRTLSGLIEPLRGSIKVLGAAPSVRAPHRLARSGVAHVTESRNLSYDLTVAENIRLGLRGSRASRRAVTREAMEMFPAMEPLLDRNAALLSGGEQQMLALARAMTSRPKLLILDEMSLGLAPIIVERLLVNVREISERTNCAVLLVEQHVPLALKLANRAYVLARGRIVGEGSAEELQQNLDVLESSYMGEAVLEQSADLPGPQGS